MILPPYKDFPELANPINALHAYLIHIALIISWKSCELYLCQKFGALRAHFSRSCWGLLIFFDRHTEGMFIDIFLYLPTYLPLSPYFGSNIIVVLIWTAPLRSEESTLELITMCWTVGKMANALIVCYQWNCEKLSLKLLCSHILIFTKMENIKWKLLPGWTK